MGRTKASLIYRRTKTALMAAARDCLSKALSTKSIARLLNLPSGTLKWHLKNIYAKLNAVAREDALAKARALGIIR